MCRIAIAGLALLLAAAEPVRETEYILRFEEFVSEMEVPVLIGQCPEGIHYPDEELRQRFEIMFIPDRPFHVKVQQESVTRELSGIVSRKADGKFSLIIAYSRNREQTDPSGLKRKDASSVETIVSSEHGKQIRLGAMKSISIQTSTAGLLESHRSISFGITIVAPKTGSANWLHR